MSNLWRVIWAIQHPFCTACLWRNNNESPVPLFRFARAFFSPHPGELSPFFKWEKNLWTHIDSDPAVSPPLLSLSCSLGSAEKKWFEVQFDFRTSKKWQTDHEKYICMFPSQKGAFLKPTLRKWLLSLSENLFFYFISLYSLFIYMG